MAKILLILVFFYFRYFTFVISMTTSNGMSYLGTLTALGGLGDSSFEASDYYASNNAAPWANANNDCRAIFGSNGGLVSIDSETEKNWLDVHLENYGSGITYWTSGLFDPASQVWRWATNNQLLPSWSPWVSPPSNPNSSLRVALLYLNRYSANWITIANTQLQRYICEVQHPTVISTTDRPTTTTMAPSVPNITTTCGWVLSGSAGQIRYTSQQPIDAYEVCMWMITTESYSEFRFNVVQAGFSFLKDQHLYLSVFRHSGYPDHASAELVQPGISTFTGNVAILTFTTARNAPLSGRNFILEYTTTPASGGTQISSNSVHLIYPGSKFTTSFTYPFRSDHYDNNELTVIAFPPPSGIYTVANYHNKFTVTQTDGMESGCKDFLKVYRLDPYHTGLYNNYETCGGDVYSSRDSPMTVVVFMSDNSTVGKGFRIEYDWGN